MSERVRVRDVERERERERVRDVERERGGKTDKQTHKLLLNV